MKDNNTDTQYFDSLLTDDELRKRNEKEQYGNAWKHLAIGQAISADALEIKKSGHKYKLFLTLTPKNPNSGVRKLVNDANQLLKMLLASLKRQGIRLEGYAALEKQKFRCGHLVPHLHLMLRSSKKGINSMSDEKLKNRIYSLACDSKPSLFSPKGIDVQRVYNKSGLFNYISKTASDKSFNRDFITPLNDDGLLDVNLVAMGA